MNIYYHFLSLLINMKILLSDLFLIIYPNYKIRMIAKNHFFYNKVKALILHNVYQIRMLCHSLKDVVTNSSIYEIHLNYLSDHSLKIFFYLFRYLPEFYLHGKQCRIFCFVVLSYFHFFLNSLMNFYFKTQTIY